MHGKGVDAVRLFIALPLPDEVRRAALAGIDALRRQGVSAGFTRPENLHVTLAFIGESDRTAALQRCIDAACGAPFLLTVGGSGRFGDLIWAGVRVSPPLAALERRLRAALRAEGFRVDERPFRPHITLARAAQGATTPEIAETGATADRVSLMKSERIGGRLVYTALYTRRMKAAEEGSAQGTTLRIK